MKIGFSGTREGMTKEQCSQLEAHLHGYWDNYHPISFAHGSCVGADAEAHRIARIYAHSIEIFPPENDKLMAHLRGSIMHPPAPYLERNIAIAKWCDVLIAAPKTLHSKIVSRGTWHTVKHAERLGKKVILLTP